MFLSGCNACKGGVEQPFPFSMAFQPILDVISQTAFAYEALVRGPQSQSAATVLSQVTPDNRYAFDQSCRVRAITLTSQLGLVSTDAYLSINFMPGAVYSPLACIQTTLKTAREVGFPASQLIFEITEDEEVVDRAHLNAIVAEYQQQGMKVALDDFGAGFSGLNLLAEISADVVKLDMMLIREIHLRPKAQAIVKSMVALSNEFGMSLIAEGIESVEEYSALYDCGIALMQGYLFAKPAFETLPPFSFPA